MLDVWKTGKPAFGVYAPSESERGQPPKYTPEGAQKVAANTLYDYVFLNLEGAYDAAAVKAYGADLKKTSKKTLIVRIPPIEKDGAAATKARVKEILDAGADGGGLFFGFEHAGFIQRLFHHDFRGSDVEIFAAGLVQMFEVALFLDQFQFDGPATFLRHLRLIAQRAEGFFERGQ